jgi:hypothetical protein
VASFAASAKTRNHVLIAPHAHTYTPAMWQYPTDENAPPRGGLTEYELAREANIARNRAEFQARGLHDLAAALRPPVAGAAGAGQERCGARAGGGGPGLQRPKAAAAPSTRAEPYPLRHARPHKEVSKKVRLPDSPDALCVPFPTDSCASLSFHRRRSRSSSASAKVLPAQRRRLSSGDGDVKQRRSGGCVVCGPGRVSFPPP